MIWEEVGSIPVGGQWEAEHCPCLLGSATPGGLGYTWGDLEFSTISATCLTPRHQGPGGGWGGPLEPGHGGPHLTPGRGVVGERMATSQMPQKAVTSRASAGPPRPQGLCRWLGNHCALTGWESPLPNNDKDLMGPKGEWSPWRPRSRGAGRAVSGVWFSRTSRLEERKGQNNTPHFPKPSAHHPLGRFTGLCTY